MASESTRRRQQVSVSISLDHSYPLLQNLAVINVILTAVNYFDASKYHTGVEIVISVLFCLCKCMFVYFVGALIHLPYF